MKIKAKKINSTSENAIRSSYFVIQSCKVMHLSRSTLSMKRMTLLNGYMCFTVDVSTQKNKNTDQSYQWPATLGYSKQRLAEKASVMHGWLSM